MTHWVMFHAHEAFLQVARDNISSANTGNAKWNPSTGASTILVLCAGLEAFVNRCFESSRWLNHCDSLRLHHKIETLYEFRKIELDWGRAPWQSVAELIAVRNWLAHFKDPFVGGLVGTDYSTDTGGRPYKYLSSQIKPTKFSIEVHLSIEYCSKQYQNLRTALIDLGDHGSFSVNLNAIKTEAYAPVTLG